MVWARAPFRFSGSTKASFPLSLTHIPTPMYLNTYFRTTGPFPRPFFFISLGCLGFRARIHSLTILYTLRMASIPALGCLCVPVTFQAAQQHSPCAHWRNTLLVSPAIPSLERSCFCFRSRLGLQVPHSAQISQPESLPAVRCRSLPHYLPSE